MARRATDLLDVFRSDRQPSGGASGGRGASKPPREKRRFEGLLLLPRQLLLGSSIVVLLLVFAFVLGLSVGRRGGEGDGSASLAANTARPSAHDERQVYVAGRVPAMDPARQIANEPKRLRDALVVSRGVPAERIWIRREASSQMLVVLLGPFADRTQATDFLASSGLVMAKLGGTLPFRSPEFLALLPADLPEERLPR